jgi:hypothetical protein
VRILKDFKFNHFGSADSKQVTDAFFVSADSEGLRSLTMKIHAEENVSDFRSRERAL